MKTLAIFLAAMCVVAQATSFAQAPAFIQFKAEPFGKAMTSLIEMNMAIPSGNLDAIAEALNSIQATLESQVAGVEEATIKQNSWCSDTLEAQGANLANAKSDLESYLAEQGGLQKQQADSQESLDTEKDDLQANQSNEANSLTALADENTRFENSAKDYAESIAACQQALQLLSTLQVNPTALIQSKTHFGNVITLLQTHLSNNSSPLVEPVLQVLSELTSKSKEVDQAQLVQIITLIEQLLGELTNQQSQNQSRHDVTVAQLTESTDNLEVLTGNNEASIDKLDASLEQGSARLAQLANLIAEARALVDLFGTQIEDTKTQCDQYVVNNVQHKGQLTAQLETLQKIKEYFLNKIVPAVEDVSDSAVEDQLTVEVEGDVATVVE